MERLQGYAQQGNTTVLSSLGTSVSVDGSFPGCTISIYDAGTVNLSTIYSDNLASPTAKANPFTAGADGYWFFYAANGRYDVQFSGTGIATPFTLGDFLLNDGTSAGNTTVQSYAKASLPTAGNAGRLAKITNFGQDIWMDTGSIDWGDGEGERKQFYSIGQEWINVKALGAKGDGVTDDGGAFAQAATLVNAAGRGEILVPPGNYFLFEAGKTYDPLMDLTTLSNFSMHGFGATLALDPARVWTPNLYATFLKLTACSNVTIDGFNGTGPTLNLASGTYHGVEFLRCLQGCKNIHIPRLTLDKWAAGVIMAKASTDPDSYKTKNYQGGLLKFSNGFYAINGQWSGDDSNLGDIVTSVVYRSCFMYGVNNVKVRVISANPLGSTDVSFSGAYTYGIRNVDIDYTNHDSDASTNSCAGVEISHSGHSNPTTIEDVRIHFDVRYPAAGNKIGPAFNYTCRLDNGSLDTVGGRGHILRGMRVSGFVDGTPAPGNYPVQVGQPTTVWTGNSIYDLTLRDMICRNNTSAYQVVLEQIMPALKGTLTLENMWIEDSIDIFGASNPRPDPTDAGARLVVRGVQCANLDAYTTLWPVRVIQLNTTPVTLLDFYRELTITNDGAAGSVTYTLPPAVTGRHFRIARAEDQNIVINTDSVADFIGPDHQITLSLPNDFIDLDCFVDTEWTAIPGRNNYRPVLATGASAAPDDIITVLQNMGLVRQS